MIDFLVTSDYIELDICNGLAMVWTIVGYLLIGIQILVTIILLLKGLIKMYKELKGKRTLSKVFKETLLEKILIVIIFNILFIFFRVSGKYILSAINSNSCIKCAFDVNESGCGIIDEGVYKPVIYLYPTEETEVTVKFKDKSILTTTYPKYNNEWKVKAYPSGSLYDKDGKYYYALYWEGRKYNQVDYKEGFYVTKDNAIEFLESKLSIIGLNEKERNEFIMYWLPVLESNEKSLVYFELTSELQKDNELIISPTPDSLLRVLMYVKKVDKEVSIKEQILPTFERVGFTVVEWGGTKE